MRKINPIKITAFTLALIMGLIYSMPSYAGKYVTKKETSPDRYWVLATETMPERLDQNGYWLNITHKTNLKTSQWQNANNAKSKALFTWVSPEKPEQLSADGYWLATDDLAALNDKGDYWIETDAPITLADNSDRIWIWVSNEPPVSVDDDDLWLASTS